MMANPWMRAAALATLALAAGCSKPAGAPASASASSAASAASAAAAAITTTVPFVGCASDGQVGPQAAPTGGPKSVTMDAAAAAKLAYYVMENGPGVLAPRGWSCAGIYGSDGATLIVAPQAVKPGDLLAQGGWSGAAGDAIQVTVASGDTSGRFQVAQAVMRLFPAHRAFAQSVVDEGVEPASDFPAGPYPSDKMTTRSGELVEFATPANTIGFGTDVNTNTRLKPGADPVQGAVALIGGTPDLLFAVVRLSPDLQSLATPIVTQFEADNPAGGSQAQPTSSSAQ
jgi:hypothetical protein